MDKVKPYMFYIVCGVLLLIEFVLMAVVSPSNVEAPDSTVEQSKRDADSAYSQKLTRDEPPLGLERRADKTLSRPGQLLPENPRQPEKEEHVSEILDNYIIHKEWNDIFQLVVNDYREQLANIQAELVRLSEALGEPVSSSSDPGQWYQAYQQSSVRLLTLALQNEVMVEPAKPRNPAGAGGGAFGGGFGAQPPQPAPGVTTGGQGDDWTETELEETAALRTVIGLYTAAGQFPPADEHAKLTTRLRIIERVIEALVRSQVQALPNPNLVSAENQEMSVPEVTGPTRATVVSLTWGDSKPAAMRGATYHAFELKLQGTPSALLAAVARLDSLDTPIAVRLGSTWAQAEQRLATPSAAAVGTTPELKPDGAMVVTLPYVVVDFRGLKGVDLTQPVAATAPGTMQGGAGGQQWGNEQPWPEDGPPTGPEGGM